jgi:DNA-binding transcriptional regulator YiaG
MPFPDDLKQWSAAKIAETLGCPERIVYAWKKGERQPRPWIQRLILDRLKRVKSDVAQT